jgi:NAD(P)-dependent dehydrogenase (short-subunit alcohol dehydrogenase family)
MLDELRFNGAAVLVTGAGSGIGRATCLVLAELGASVILVGRRLEALRETEALLAPWNTKAECFSCDVSVEDNVIALHAAVAARWPSIKALVNNAGGSRPGAKVTELSKEAWHLIVDANLSSVFYMTKHFMPLLQAAPSPSIVNIASAAGGMMPMAERPSYGASKGGVIALSRQLALDYGPQGVRVNAVSPGRTISADKPSATSDAQNEEMIRRTALRRIASPRELANAIAFIASDAASFVHGTDFVVDGGRTIT